MIGISGASGTGKTTLAIGVSKKFDIEFIHSRSREAHKACGMLPNKDYEFEKRMSVQEKILDLSERSYKTAESMFVSDRTPIDFLAYTIADIGRTTLTKYQSNLFFDYAERCIDITNKYFGTIVIVRTGINMVDDNERPTCPAYAMHIDSIIMGIISGYDLSGPAYFINKNVTSLNERIAVVAKIMKKVNEAITREVVGIH